MADNDYAFFAMMARLKWIDRWALMRNSEEENLSEHSLQVAMLSHVLCVIGNKRFGKNLDAEHAAMFGMYHDVSEILTGDMPTPVKYRNKTIKGAYKQIEDDANESLLTLLPEDIREEYRKVLFPEDEFAYEVKLVKAADKISAYIKCLEEKKAGNDEFADAEQSTLESIKAMELEEIDVFLEEFLPAYKKTLDAIRPEI
ncbi:MAG: 5'-deoxynucleotidase [Lachnospiraceae bacterium]|nr:5'-deoxynucleotidase [Lachnospiraceae bacterium]